MIYLLDSNVCIQLLNGRHRGLIDCFHRHDPQDIVLCSMVKGELRRGALRSQRIELNLQRLETFFALLKSLPFDDTTALAHNATLITHNTGEFGRVMGLRMEDWEVA